MKKRLFGLILSTLLLASCGASPEITSNTTSDSNQTTESNTTTENNTTTTESSTQTTKKDAEERILLSDSYSAISKFKTYEDYDATYEKADEVVSINATDIESYFKRHYSYNQNYNYFETNRSYELSIPFAQSQINKAQTTTSSSSDDITIDLVTVNDTPVDFETEDGKLILSHDTYKDIFIDNLAVHVEYHTKDGNEYTSDTNYEIPVNEEEFSISLTNAKVSSGSFSLNCNVTRNNSGNGGGIYFIVFDGQDIIHKEELFEGTTTLSLWGLLLGHKYEYAIVNLANASTINSSILKGSFESLLPFNTLINDITSNSISFSIASKSTSATFKKVEILDGKEVIYEAKNISNFNVDDLKEDHTYKIKTYYSYYSDWYLLTFEDSYEKEFTTLKGTDKKIELNYNFDNLDVNYSNGSEVEVTGHFVQEDKEICLKGASTLTNNNGTFEAEGQYVKLTLTYPSLIFAGITGPNGDTSQSEKYSRTCVLTDGYKYYYFAVYHYEYGRTIKSTSFYLTAGTYFIYSSQSDIYVHNLKIIEIIDDNFYNQLLEKDNKELKVNDSNPFYYTGQTFDTSDYNATLVVDNYILDTSNISYKMTLKKDLSTSLEISNSTEIPSDFYGNCVIEAYSSEFNFAETYDRYIFDSSNITISSKLNSTIRLVYKEQLNYSSYIVYVTYESSDYTYTYSYMLSEVDENTLCTVVYKDGEEKKSVHDVLLKDINSLKYIETDLAYKIYVHIPDPIMGRTADIGFNLELEYYCDEDFNNLTATKNTINYHTYVFSYKTPLDYVIINKYDKDITLTELLEYQSDGIGFDNIISYNYYLDSEGKTDPVEYDYSDFDNTYYLIVYSNSQMLQSFPFKNMVGEYVEAYLGNEIARRGELGTTSWSITSSQEINFKNNTKVSSIPGQLCDETNSTAQNVFAFGIADDITITSPKFSETKKAYVDIISGTKQSAGDFYMDVVALDKDGNVVFTKTVLVARDKITQENNVLVESDVPFVEIQLKNITTTKTDKRIGIYSIRIELIEDDE